jgi:hypothetical protein
MFGALIWIGRAVTLAFANQFRLAGPRGDGRHPYVNNDGAFIGRGVPLLARDPLGRWRPREEAVLGRLLRTGYGEPFELGWRARHLRHIAAALNDSDLALASISLLQMQLPPLRSASHARAMAKADGLLVKDNPDWEDEPRVPAGNPDGGRWTADAGSDDTVIEPAAVQIDATQAKKERFVDAHLADAQEVADRLGVPVENILALSALESRWGEHRFAAENNNYFGIHYPAPYATGYVSAGRGPAKVAVFASYADSARSFEAVSGQIIGGIRDPQAFAAGLQNSGKFGIDPDTGKKIPGYVEGVAATIRGLRSTVARRRL